MNENNQLNQTENMPITVHTLFGSYELNCLPTRGAIVRALHVHNAEHFPLHLTDAVEGEGEDVWVAHVLDRPVHVTSGRISMSCRRQDAGGSFVGRWFTPRHVNDTNDAVMSRAHEFVLTSDCVDESYVAHPSDRERMLCQYGRPNRITLQHSYDVDGDYAWGIVNNYGSMTTGGGGSNNFATMREALQGCRYAVRADGNCLKLTETAIEDILRLEDVHNIPLPSDEGEGEGH